LSNTHRHQQPLHQKLKGGGPHPKRNRGVLDKNGILSWSGWVSSWQRRRHGSIFITFKERKEDPVPLREVFSNFGEGRVRRRDYRYERTRGGGETGCT